MSRREVLFAIYDGECGGPCGIVLAAYVLGNEVLLIVQLPDYFELWTLANIVGRGYTFRNRAEFGVRQPLELLIMSWLQSSTGDLCLLPEYVDTAPIGIPTEDDFLQMWKTSGRVETSDILRELMAIWMFQSFTFLPFASTEISVVTSDSYTNLREQFKQMCGGCPDCQSSTVTMCVKDPRIHHNHAMCGNHLIVYLESHIQLLKGALAVQPVYRPQYLLCPWCAAIVDFPTLLCVDVSNENYVSLVIQLYSMLEKPSE